MPFVKTKTIITSKFIQQMDDFTSVSLFAPVQSLQTLLMENIKNNNKTFNDNNNDNVVNISNNGFAPAAV